VFSDTNQDYSEILSKLKEFLVRNEFSKLLDSVRTEQREI
jgi:hypothetical protein